LAQTGLFFQIFIYLVAAVCAVPLAKRCGLGSVLGYLIAGILIGPFALKLIGHIDTSVEQVSEFGVVMMLFLVGLELKPAMLWNLRVPLLCMGGLQVIVTAVVICALVMLLGFRIRASLAVGLILALSSTAIVLQSFHEKGWMTRVAGKHAVAVLLFQDIAAIPMLALMPLLASRIINVHYSAAAAWKQALLVTAAVLGIIVAGRFLLRPILRYIAASKLRESFTATALLIVIGIALAMQAVGLSPALGTFLAGVVLADSEYRHELESDIEPFKGLLLGLFFISVGVSINFDLVFQNPFLICGLVLALILIKAAVILGLNRGFKLPIRDNILLAMALAQGGEFCFVLLSYAVQQEVLTAEVGGLIKLVVALSMLLTPLIILIYAKFVEPRFLDETAQESDIEEQDNPVVIAGFGRVGQIVGRLLMANGVKTTVLDVDATYIDTLRKVGFKVFYGDVDRMSLLQKAGLDKAKLFILAIDDSELALKIAKEVRNEYPHLKILARVRGRAQAFDFINNGFVDCYRETYDTSLHMGIDALRHLGFSARQAHKAGDLFKKLDTASLHSIAPLYGKDDQAYFNQARLNRENLEKAFAADRELVKNATNHAWGDLQPKKDS
jgi:monovalent cation:proton antiporter-2 (CPA2) family protein